jgi:hypothetical protein
MFLLYTENISKRFSRPDSRVREVSEYVYYCLKAPSARLATDLLEPLVDIEPRCGHPYAIVLPTVL